VQRLLDCVVNYLPSPIDVPPCRPDSDGKTVEAVVDDKGKMAGLAFKLWNDPFVGRLVFFRVYTGTLRRACRSTIRAPPYRAVSRLVLMRAIERENRPGLLG